MISESLNILKSNSEKSLELKDIYFTEDDSKSLNMDFSSSSDESKYL
jgi:hypothetical protein